MDFPHLQSFIAAAREGSFNKAASRLGYTPQNISNTIKALEVEIGRALFERSATGTTLTEFGAAFLEQADRVVAEFEHLQRLSLEYSEDKKEIVRFRLGMSANAIRRTYARGPLLQWLEDEEKLASFVPVACAPGDGLLALDEGLLDALVFGAFDDRRHLARFEDLSIHKLGAVPLVVALSRQSPLADRQSLSLGELSGYFFVSFANNSLQKLALQEKCSRIGLDFTYLNDLLRSEVKVWECVEADQAALFVHSSPHWALEHPGCVFIPLRPASYLTIDMFLVYRKEKSHSSMRELESRLAALFAETIPTEE